MSQDTDLLQQETEQEVFRPDTAQPRLIRIPVRTPFEVGTANVYLCPDGPLTLVDTGPGTPEALEDLRAGLAAQGYRIRDVQRLILTHGHVDHWGLAAQIVALSGAKVVAHRSMCLWTVDFPAEWRRRLAYLSLLCVDMGVPAGEMPALNGGIKRVGSFAESVALDQLLDDGDEIELAAGVWTVLYTPGHATTHISLHQPESRALICGDHVLPDISSNPVLEAPAPGSSARPRMLPLYLESLERTLRLPVLWLYPGHGAPFVGHRKLIKSRLELHEKRAARLLGFLAEEPATCFVLARRLFPRLEGVNLFLGISETLGHLDLLEDRGQVATSRDGRVLIYSKIRDI